MEFDENEDEQDEEIGNQVQPNYETPPPPPLGRGPLRKGGGGGGGGSFRYRECLKNHAVGIGGHAVDGCGEFLPSGEEGSLDALICAACNCHRNFHRKESTGQPSQHHHQHHHSHQQQQLSPFYHRTGSHPPGYGLHHVATAPPPPLNQRPLALPSLSRDEEDMSNPSSSGGGGGGGSSRKRFRTRFTQEQKDKMLEFAERVGWRIQKQDEGSVEQFCGEIGVRRQVLKVWMHNNKHTLGKKP
ncbi:hypothetical protein Vadar_004936 [Vaccinium darrowii]|uniref:Uncharacterized protein n=1 Tax=Vaccinium darrowii TaxID=229202 RepID=A0ACB7Y5D4_9ERIC|nr:hypothetical protein Vadar_004936 [Vaccinium darrowii]